MAIDTVASPEGGPNAYAVGIQGDFLAPELCDGDIAVFDPDAGSGLRHAIVAVWPHDAAQPSVVRLAVAMPPEGRYDELELLGIQTANGPRMVRMSNIAKVHRLVHVLRAAGGVS